MRALLRAASHRGGDIRITTGDLLRPDTWPRRAVPSAMWNWKVCLSFKWQQSEHINSLEVRSFLSTLRWRLQKPKNVGTRFLHLLDSQVAIAVIIKGRSSSYSLSKLMERVSALVLAGGLAPSLAYVATWDNPADRPSRWAPIQP